MVQDAPDAEVVPGGAPEIEVTREMIKAGEAVLDRAFANAGLEPSWTVFSSLRDVYIAMTRAEGPLGSCAQRPPHVILV
jgi:hypothetical protein